MKSRSHIFFTYFSAWILITVFYAVLLWVAYNIDFRWAAADSVISTTLLFIIGLALYFMIQYEDHMRFSKVRSAFQLSFGYLVAVSLFYIISDPILQYIAETNDVYKSLYEVSRIPRMIVAAMLLLLMLLAFRLYKNLQMLREKTEQGMRLQSMLQESELNALRWQINPHFLFNSLNSVSSLTIGNPQQAREMIIKLSELLRYSLRKNDEQFSTLEQEINHIRLYTDIEKVRFGDRLNVAIDAPEQCLSMKMPFLILQPLIENAVKHGVYSTEQQSTIQVHCECSLPFLVIQIKNSYDPEGRTRTGTGTGLSNTAGRIRLMYNDDSLFRTSDSGNTFRVILKIPQL
jgi:LytS/YehU family sensor histidine kinase